MATTLAEQIGVEQVGPDEFLSLCAPARMGNQLPIAYGGCTMGVGVHAAARTVDPEKHTLYSVLGHFLGPSMTDRKLTCRVQRLRDTRTFATRRVDVTQTLASGETRLCMSLVADFHAREPAMVQYSTPPVGQYSDVSECPRAEEQVADFVARGLVDLATARAHAAVGREMGTWFEMRQCPEGVWGQNLGGVARGAATTQDHLPITSKTSGDWFRATQTPASAAEQAAALAFMMDAGPSFMPLIHDHKSMGDAGACSTLDFALRVMVTDLELEDWHLRERMTVDAAAARNYAESRLWDYSGKMVASMTQQCIIRPKPQARPAL